MKKKTSTRKPVRRRTADTTLALLERRVVFERDQALTQAMASEAFAMKLEAERDRAIAERDAALKKAGYAHELERACDKYKDERDKAIADAIALDNEHARVLGEMFAARLADRERLESARHATQRTAAERDRYVEEIAQLRQALDLADAHTQVALAAAAREKDAQIESLKRQITNQLEREAKDYRALEKLCDGNMAVAHRLQRACDAVATRDIDRALATGECASGEDVEDSGVAQNRGLL